MDKAKLLLVDDDSLVLATFGKGLQEQGYQVELVNSAEEALDVAPRILPDLAILDIQMPEISGIDVARSLFEMGISSIFLTAYDNDEYVKNAVEYGALAYLIKPIDVVKAIPTIETALRRSQELTELRETKNRLSNALDTGHLVNTVVGMMMERHRLQRQDAFEIIRRKARSEQRKVRDVAAEILDAWDVINSLPTPVRKN
ncbi:MAG: response regulator [Chromatiales bacterium]|jgi:response regulator NasT